MDPFKLVFERLAEILYRGGTEAKGIEQRKVNAVDAVGVGGKTPRLECQMRC